MRLVFLGLREDGRIDARRQILRLDPAGDRIIPVIGLEEIALGTHPDQFDFLARIERGQRHLEIAMEIDRGAGMERGRDLVGQVSLEIKHALLPQRRVNVRRGADDRERQ